VKSLRTESEIIVNWTNGLGNPLVSVCCMTYNHEFYIDEAICSFLMQETTFPFEILISEDFSTDNTASIVRKYEKMYPNIIKPIYQKENQFSKGVRPNLVFNFPRAKGEYIAICEGDDYWINAKKLQMQVDRMREVPEVDISFHSSYELKGDKIGREICSHYTSDRIYTISEVILGGSEFLPTASIIFKRELLERIPMWLYKAPIVDYFLQVLGSSNNGALYINDSMSIYRVDAINSATKIINASVASKKEWMDACIISLDELNKELCCKYQYEINKIKSRIYFAVSNFYLDHGMIDDFKYNMVKYYELLEKIGFKDKIYYIFINFPLSLKLLRTVRNFFL